MCRHIALIALLLVITGLGDSAEAKRKRKGSSNTGTLTIACPVEGAEVTLNGKKAGVTPVEPLLVTPGIVQVRIKRLGYMEVKRTVSIKKGKTVEVKADLLPFAGVLAVTANVKNAEVLVDNEKVGKAPLEYEVALGVRNVKVTAPGYVAFTRKINAAAGKRIDLQVTLQSDGTAPPADDGDLALAPLIALAPPGKGGAASQPEPADDLGLEMPPLSPVAGGTGTTAEGDEPLDLGLEVLPPSGNGELALEAPTAAPELTALPPTDLTMQVEPPTPWYLRWYTLTGAAVVVAAAVIIPTVIVTTAPKCQVATVNRWLPGSSAGTVDICVP